MDIQFITDSEYSSLIYLAISAGTGVVLALVVRFLTSRTKAGIKKINPTSIRAQLIDAMDGALSLWIVLSGFYFGLKDISILSEYVSILGNIYAVLSISLAVYAVIRMQGYLISWLSGRVRPDTDQGKVVNSLFPLGRQILTLATIVMGFLIILDQLGISIAPLIAGLGIGGLAVALALQGVLTNFFAGVTVMTDGSIRVGDYVELEGGVVGLVDMIGWRTTRIRMLSDNMLIIPNSRLADNVATNFSYPAGEMSVYVQVGVSYFSDLENVEKVTIEVAQKVIGETQGAVKDFEPSVWYTEFGDSNINFWVVLRSCDYLSSWLVKHAFIKDLFNRYEQEGIEISFPARNVFIRSNEG